MASFGLRKGCTHRHLEAGPFLEERLHSLEGRCSPEDLGAMSFTDSVRRFIRTIVVEHYVQHSAMR